MTKILVGGAGGAPSEGVIKSLKRWPRREQILGMGSSEIDLLLSKADRKYLVENADSTNYLEVLLSLLKTIKPDFLHLQNDLEIFTVSKIRDLILETGVKLFMPEHDVIEKCVYKYNSYLAFKAAGIKVPRNIMIENKEQLKSAFSELSNSEGQIWLRSNEIGGGGKGSLSTHNYDLAKSWIDHFEGWGSFIAAEKLSPSTVTWLSIWHRGELIVAQSRKRVGWVHSNRSVSGVTGVTHLGITNSDQVVDDIAIKSILAVSDSPHGIFGVDMTYDYEGIPNPTEINISRFFTTILFFTEAALNMPKIYINIAL
jgi:carbamoyl-phosphate synthase large subunit